MAMTREEAIKIINCYDIGFHDLSGEKIPADKLADAFNMAIEALQFADHFDLLKEYQSLQEVVRCKDCRMTRGRDEHIGRWWCFVHQGYMADDYYCADGKRREDGEEE